MKTLFTLTLFVLINLTSVAAEPQTFKKAMKHYHQYVGEWTIHWQIRNADGEWSDHGTSPAKIEKILNGAGVTESFVMKSGDTIYNLHGMIAYDEIRQVYRGAFLDDVTGLLDIYEGQKDGDTLVLDNLQSQTFAKTEDGTEMAFRLSFTYKDADNYDILAEISTDRGKHWFPYIKGQYKRDK